MRAIQDNTTTAALRRIYFLIFAAPFDGSAWAGSVTGVKAQLSVNGGAETASTADITRVGGLLHYVELTQAECDRAAGDRVHARVAAASGRLEAIGAADITADFIYGAALTASEVATAVAAPSAATIAAAVRDEMLSVRWGVQSQPSGGSTQTLAIADQPSGTSLGVVRRFWSGPNNTGTLVGQTELTPS